MRYSQMSVEGGRCVLTWYEISQSRVRRLPDVPAFNVRDVLSNDGIRPPTHPDLNTILITKTGVSTRTVTSTTGTTLTGRDTTSDTDHDIKNEAVTFAVSRHITS